LKEKISRKSNTSVTRVKSSQKKWHNLSEREYIRHDSETHTRQDFVYVSLLFFIFCISFFIFFNK